MSRLRHKANGGNVRNYGEEPYRDYGDRPYQKGTNKTVYSGAGSNVIKEAEERKKGGKVMHGEGSAPKLRADKRARGGAVGRQRGGGVGANLTPLSTAARTQKLPGEQPEGSNKSD